MIDFNYNIYGITTEDFYSGTWDAPTPDTVSTGTLLETTTYYYFYEGQPLYSADRDKLLDDSVYLWHLGSGSAAGTNSSYCIGVGDTLDLQVSQNKAEKIPLAMQLTNVTNRDFSRDPRARIAYNYFNYEMMNIFDSKLFVDINPSTFCNYALVHCYRKDNNSVSQQPLSNLATYINADPENRFVTGIELQLFHGYTLPRNTYYTAIPAVSKKGFPAVDILTERFIPDNATGVKKDLQYSFIGDESYHPDWIDNKLYAPFIMANRGIWYSGNESEGNQYYIGGRTTRSVNELRNGYAQTGWSNERVTGGFIKYSDKVQEFDDVVYKWRFNMYYINGDVFLENGFPLASITGSDRIAIYTSIEIIDSKGANIGTALQRAVKHECAFLGFYFADTLTAAQTAVLGTANNNIYLPERINGTTTGRYFTGDEIPTVPYATATDTSPFKYTPAESGSDSGDLETVIHRGNVTGGLWYTLEQNQLSNLTTWLITTYRPTEAELTEDFKGVNPSDFIISLKYYPFKIQDSAAVNDVTLGGLDTGIDAPFLTRLYGQGAGYYDLGSFTFEPPYIAGNWTDSYNKILLYVPWCGFAELDAATFCQSPDNSYNTLHVTMQIDFATGCCTAYIYRNITMIDSLSGTVGVDIPLSAAAQGSYQTAIKQAEIAVKQAKLNQWAARAGFAGAIGAAAAGVASGNPLLAAAGAVGIVNAAKSDTSAVYSTESAEYTLDHTAPHIGNIESAAPFNGCISDQTAKVYIFRPATLAGADLTTYGNTVGFACCKSGKLSDFHGLTVCSNVKLDAIDAPAHHKAAIQQALIKGVYLP